MKIYVTHSSGFDYQKELYQPLRKSKLNNLHEITLPHEFFLEQFNSKEYLKECDLVLAEVSYPSEGQKIELGWASSYKVPIICIYKKGKKISDTLKTASNVFIEYESSEDMIQKLTESLSCNILN
ncbi:MAG: hypothetical protein PHQ59_03265 [Candidatus Daviesbacteria bacterium]|nr:hypothetical protein [Candidatus Daviesbacteria bacterium]